MKSQTLDKLGTSYYFWIFLRIEGRQEHPSALIGIRNRLTPHLINLKHVMHERYLQSVPYLKSNKLLCLPI